MAIILPSLGAMSGSVAGNTFSYNRYGRYVRARSTPVNPNTEYQQLVRASLALSATIWQSTMSQAERDAWNTYAFSVTRTNSLGQTYNPSGWQLFAGARAWCRRNSFSSGFLVTAPADPGAADAVNPATSTAVVLDTAAATNPQTWTDTLSGLSGWHDDVDGDLLQIQIGRQQSPGVYFYNGPWFALARYQGNNTTPPTAGNIAINQTLTAGNVIWVRFSHLDELGRMSAHTSKRVVITTN